jgi:CubicO group peptidase (beta-lactamase class C family)
MRVFALVSVTVSFAAAAAEPDVAHRVDALARPSVDAGALVGVVVGVVDPSGATHRFGYGRVALAGARVPDGKTVFEIGSVSKVFTSLLLADAVGRKQVALDDPVQKYLPPSVKLPTHDGHAITLQHLATHTSGLPRLPTNLQPRDPANPYADYTVERLYTFLSSCSLARDPGARYEYSNLGAGLLGHVLARATSQSYEELLAARITGPLGMKSTRIALGPDERARFAEGHDSDGAPTPAWDLATLTGAGGIRSTADDMLLFVRAEIARQKPLSEAFALTLEARYDTDAPSEKVGLGWHIRDDGRTVWHNGGTGGFRSYVAFDAVKKWGVVVLANSASDRVDAIGYSLLRQLGGESASVPPLRPTVTLTGAQLDPLVAHYDCAPGFAIDVRRAGDHLMVQASRQPAFRLFAASPTRFFLRAVAADIDFAGDTNARTLVLHQNGHDLTCRAARSN